MFSVLNDVCIYVSEWYVCMCKCAYVIYMNVCYTHMCIIYNVLNLLHYNINCSY